MLLRSSRLPEIIKIEHLKIVHYASMAFLPDNIHALRPHLVCWLLLDFHQELFNLLVALDCSLR